MAGFWGGLAQRGAGAVRPMVARSAATGKRVAQSVRAARTAGRSSGGLNVPPPRPTTYRNPGVGGRGQQGTLNFNPAPQRWEQPTLFNAGPEVPPRATGPAQGALFGDNVGRSSGGMRGQQTLPFGTSVNAPAARRKNWVRRNPGLALGGGAVGLGAMNLRRNTGPGATGNGYMPPGSSSGGRAF